VQIGNSCEPKDGPDLVGTQAFGQVYKLQTAVKQGVDRQKLGQVSTFPRQPFFQELPS
jgi:hypothetical protein